MNETKKRSYLVGLIIASALPAIGLPALPGTLTTASVLLYVTVCFCSLWLHWYRSTLMDVRTWR
jgi:hypothetical protein